MELCVLYLFCDWQCSEQPFASWRYFCATLCLLSVMQLEIALRGAQSAMFLQSQAAASCRVPSVELTTCSRVVFLQEEERVAATLDAASRNAALAMVNHVIHDPSLGLG